MEATFKFKLPKLHLGVLLDKKAGQEDPRRFIHVVAGHAILQNEAIIILNLREYVKLECGLKSEEDLENLSQVLRWMEGKSFDKEYWEELTSQQLIRLVPEGIEIEKNRYNNILSFEANDCDTDVMLQVVKDNIANPAITLATVGIRGEMVKLINSIFAAEMKPDTFIFDFRGQEKPVRLFGAEKDVYLGMIPVDYNAATEMLAFQNVTDFTEKLNELQQ